jgi:hypothetical protein
MKVYQDRGLIEVKRSDDRHKRVEKLRITENGIKLAKVAWERYRKFASNLLAGVSQADIEAHCRVNDAISAAISAKRQNPWDGLAGFNRSVNVFVSRFLNIRNQSLDRQVRLRYSS